jgi:predicted  nucleic acid-binding Zn-ribbon protein
MPLINYACECGINLRKYVKSAKDAAASTVCTCGKEAKKSLGATSSSYKVTIDNGVMARRVEVDPDIMRINDERSAKDYSEE